MITALYDWWISFQSKPTECTVRYIAIDLESMRGRQYICDMYLRFTPEGRMTRKDEEYNHRLLSARQPTTTSGCVIAVAFAQNGVVYSHVLRMEKNRYD